MATEAGIEIEIEIEIEMETEAGIETGTGIVIATGTGIVIATGTGIVIVTRTKTRTAIGGARATTIPIGVCIRTTIRITTRRFMTRVTTATMATARAPMTVGIRMVCSRARMMGGAARVTILTVPTFS